MAVAVPSQAPLQVASTPATGAVRIMGSVIITEVVTTHATASVIVTLKVPAHSPVAIAVVCVPGSSQSYVNGVVPPTILAVACPSHEPLHNASLLTTADATPPPISLIFTVALVVQPVLSVIVIT